MPKETFSNPNLQNDHSQIHTDHGVYHFEEDNVTVVSQPSFEDTLSAIADQKPADTMIVTPELALLDDSEFNDFSRENQTRGMLQLLHERFLRLKKVSARSNNTVLMGMPLQTRDRTGYNNGLSVVQFGMELHTQRKKNPSIHEASLDWFDYDTTHNPYRRVGATAVICSEIVFTLNLSEQTRADTSTLLMSAAWGVPSHAPQAVAKYGSVNNYNQYTLDTAVTMASDDLPNLRNVYIADRKVSDGNPQSGKISVNR